MISKLFIVLIEGSLIAIITCEPAIAQKRRSASGGSIPISELNRSKVIGSLGYALGEIVVIEGIIADENYTKRKEDDGELLLSVQTVNGKPFKNQIIFHFRTFLSAEVKKPLVGARFKYSGYETGGFTGVPEKVFGYVPLVATTGYYFSTSFVVLRDENVPK